MCLAIPGKIISIETPENGELKTAVVDFGGTFRNICIEWVDAVPGEYILAHAGVALTTVDTEEAEETLKDLETIALHTESINKTNHV
ncbi:HypC/HybG/HupF family hydrogenase formation chaperone [Coprobacter sp.]